ncbi:recombination regulator RecX [Burkholderia glumae]|uniref:recombination regulator RecX n=1 Tax=Burkholderia glumae TaxID=337 RepID=UPI001462B9BA|nr:recombination regulator RecX [Burkholderia glumae]QJP72684.1 recombination regulator RecX [Burkholderia glumae]
MRRGRGRSDASSPTSPREDRAADGGPDDRSTAAPVSRDGRPAGRCATRASDDALVSFAGAAPGEAAAAGAPARRRGGPDTTDYAAPAGSTAAADRATGAFDSDESFEAHDVARGIRTRTVRGAASSPMSAHDGAARPVAPAVPRSSSGRHFESAGGDHYSRTSEQARRGRRAAGPFEHRESRPDGGIGAAQASPSAESREADETLRPARARPARSLKGRALDYLSRREYSRSELARKLAPHVGEGDAPEALLDALEHEGWLSDARFTESLVHRRASRLGTARILGELRRHAVDGALVESVGEQLRETEFSRAQAVWRKKFGSLPATPAERAKQARFLASRGFSSATIVKLLKVGDDEFGEF